MSTEKGRMDTARLTWVRGPSCEDEDDENEEKDVYRWIGYWIRLVKIA